MDVWTKVWIGIAISVGVAACGGNFEDSPYPTIIAAAGEAMSGDMFAASGSAGDRAAAGQGGEAGSGGETSSDADVRAAAEVGLSEDDVVLDETALVGHTFELATPLCDQTSISDREADGDGPPNRLHGFHVRRAREGGLEAVTLTDGGGHAQVQITFMARSGLGWDLTGIAVCARLDYDFENAYLTTRYTPQLVHAVFRRGNAAAPLRLVLAATGKGRPFVSSGGLDQQAPTYDRIDYEATEGIDDQWLAGSANEFVFSEPLAKGSEIRVLDAHGRLAKVDYVVSAGFVVGFIVNDWLSPEAHVEADVSDLAGNVLTGQKPYPGLGLDATEGTFEDELTPWLSSDKIDVFSNACLNAEPLETPLSVTGAAVPAIAGDRSFLILPGMPEDRVPCSVYFRVKRAVGARQVRFDARRIGTWDQDVPTRLELSISSLGAGGDGLTAEDSRQWLPDSTYSTDEISVSTVESLAFPLPDVGDDFLVSFAIPDGYAWIDSLRVE